MASSVFSKLPKQQPKSNPLQELVGLANLVRQHNPAQVAQVFATKNPQFANFLKSCRGKTPEQVAQENGIDYNLVKQILKQS